MTAAFVEGRPLPAAEVYGRLAAMRGGPAAALLPDESTAEGRQLVRWLTQVAVTDRVLCDEATRRGLPPDGPPWQLDPTSRVQLGGALAAVLASSPAATAAAYAITAGVRAAAEAAADPAPPRRWVTSRGPAGPDNGGRPWLLELESLPAEVSVAVRAGAVGEQVGRYRLGEWADPRPAESSSYDGIVAARNSALLRWVDERVAAVVALEPGFEHPGDLDQPDHTHRH